MPKRPSLNEGPSTSEQHAPPAKKARTAAAMPQFLAGLSINLIPAKLSDTHLAHLCCLAESHGARLVSSPTAADVVLTAVGARKRLERHMDRKEGERRWVLKTQWLEDSAAAGKVEPWQEYLAVPDLRPRSPTSRQPTPALTSTSSTAPNSPDHLLASATDLRRTFENRKIQAGISPKQGSSSSVSDNDIPLDFTPGWPIPDSRYACKRRTPLYTPNEKLLRTIAIIMRSRELEGEDRSALSYARGISVLKAYPKPITSTDQIRHLPSVGPKICHLVDQFLETGYISEAATIVGTDRYRALEELTRVHSVGSTTARALYAKGITNIEELREWVDMGNGGEVLQMALEVHDDLMIRIPRDEVEFIGRKVQKALDAVMPGCKQTICGGYRRGKPTSGDVDVIFTHPEQGKEQGLIENVVNYLSNEGFITHIFGVMHPGHNPFSHSSHTRSKLQPGHPSSHFDTLSKALVVCRPSIQEGGAGLHRRLDLICAPWDVYWCAVVGWSGSKQFERDLRLWAKAETGVKFDSSGLTRVRDTVPIYVNSEKEIFELLGLEYVPPRLRNADM